MTIMMEKAHRTLFIGLFIVVLLSSTGCGNRVEINDRSIVLGVAIDKPLAPEENTKNQKQQGETQKGKQQGKASGAQGQGAEGFLRAEPPPKDQTPRYAMTIETPIIAQLGSNSGGGGGGGGGGQGAGKSWVITSTGNTIWDIERSLSIRAGRQDFYGHLVVIVVSEEVAREGIEPVLDFFTRRREVQQNIKLAISNGEARKVLQVIPVEESFAAFYVDAMLESLYRTGAKINTDMLEIRRSLAESGNAVLPRVRASSSSEIVAGGAAVVKKWKFRGWLSEFETSGYNIVQNNLIGGSINVVDPKNKFGLLTVLVRNIHTKRSVKLERGKPVYKIEITSEWDIVEKGTGTDLWDTNYLHQVESRLELEIQRRTLHVIDKMQREFRTDIFGFGGMVFHKYPDYWDSVKKQWDDKYFPQAKVNIEVSAKIRRTESKT